VSWLSFLFLLLLLGEKDGWGLEKQREVCGEEGKVGGREGGGKEGEGRVSLTRSFSSFALQSDLERSSGGRNY